MKTIACLLALTIAFPCAPALGAEQGQYLPPISVRVPRRGQAETRNLKRVEAGGAAAAGVGLGAMTYIVFFAGGPIGWAAATVYLGGMAAYLSRRRLRGQEDFGYRPLP